MFFPFSPSIFKNFQILRIHSRGVSSDLEEYPPILNNLQLRMFLEMKFGIPKRPGDFCLKEDWRVLQIPFLLNGIFSVLYSPIT